VEALVGAFGLRDKCQLAAALIKARANSSWQGFASMPLFLHGINYVHKIFFSGFVLYFKRTI